VTTEPSPNGADYCHIHGSKGILCGTTDVTKYWTLENPAIERQQKKGLKVCDKCHKPRCQECIRLWQGIQMSLKTKGVVR
jgi:hypothetical protein